MSFWGDPGTSSLIQTRGTAPTKPPGYTFAQWLFQQLPQLMNTPYPTYQGNLDPGLSPTLADTIRRAQGYAQSSPPEILSGVQGALGRFMSPRQINPFSALFGGGGQNMTGGPTGGGGTGGMGGMGGGGMSGMGGGGIAGLFGPNGPSGPSMFGGAPNYMGVNPSQTVYGGRPANSNTWQMPTPTPQLMAPQAPPPQSFSSPNQMNTTYSFGG